TWAHLFGRGLVNPVDDMHDDNAASHPELLKDLAKQFGENGFDVKQLLRAICLSETYQRSSKPLAGNKDASPSLYAHMHIKVMSPGVLYDALQKTLGAPVGGRGPGPRGAGAGPRGAGGPRDQFIAFFGLEDGYDPTEYLAGIPQALRLMNGPMANASGRARELARAGTTEKVIESLYLTTLARRP